MHKYNPVNERIKHQYFAYLKEAKQQSQSTVDDVAVALARFEGDTGYRDFKAFHYEQAIAFKRRLAEQQSKMTGNKLSKATMYSMLAHLKRFFLWLAGQSRIRYSDADYFNLSDKDTRIATAHRERKSPTIEQVTHVIEKMPCNTEIERRNRAVIAFTLATGARDSAIASMKLKHVDLLVKCVYQDAREVKTKFSKTFTTTFFPVEDEVHQIIVDWVTYLRQDKLWRNDDPLFPATHVTIGGDQLFTMTGLERKHWSNATPIRKIFHDALRRPACHTSIRMACGTH